MTREINKGKIRKRKKLRLQISLDAKIKEQKTKDEQKWQ